MWKAHPQEMYDLPEPPEREERFCEGKSDFQLALDSIIFAFVTESLCSSPPANIKKVCLGFFRS